MVIDFSLQSDFVAFCMCKGSKLQIKLPEWLALCYVAFWYSTQYIRECLSCQCIASSLHIAAGVNAECPSATQHSTDAAQMQDYLTPLPVLLDILLQFIP